MIKYLQTCPNTRRDPLSIFNVITHLQLGYFFQIVMFVLDVLSGEEDELCWILNDFSVNGSVSQLLNLQGNLHYEIRNNKALQFVTDYVQIC